MSTPRWRPDGAPMAPRVAAWLCPRAPPGALASLSANTYTRATLETDPVHMLIACPSCGTRYRVAPEALGPGGRKLRCARCDHTWSERRPEEGTPGLGLAGPGEEARGLDLAGLGDEPRPRRREPRRARERGPRTNVAGWAALALVVVAVLGGGIVARERIVAAWPPAARLFDVVGLAVAYPGAGLEFRNVHSSREVDDGAPVLVVTGEVVNVTAAARDVPRLRIALRDGARREIGHRLVALARSRLEAGESAPFSASLEPPPAGLSGIVVSFESGG